MTITRKSCIIFSTAAFRKKIAKLSSPFVKRFAKINRRYVLFHTFFISLLAFELTLFGLLFASFLQSTTMAFSLAAIFLTVFSYLVLLFYLQGRRPEKLMQLRDEYLDASRRCIPFNRDTLEYHCCITETIVHFIPHLKIENVTNPWIISNETFSYLANKFRIWTRWKDLLKLKEMLLLSSIKEHIRLIKRYPSDIEAHASLASNYVELAHLYQDPAKLTLNDKLVWSPPEYASLNMRKKFEIAFERALEEYHIIDEYAPNDPWVHVQRAALYNELGKTQEEQAEYEKILAIDPENSEILFRLGKLYFQMGENAKGLKIYHQLQQWASEKGEKLIAYYDAYRVKEYVFENSP